MQLATEPAVYVYIANEGVIYIACYLILESVQIGLNLVRALLKLLIIVLAQFVIREETQDLCLKKADKCRGGVS